MPRDHDFRQLALHPRTGDRERPTFVDGIHNLPELGIRDVGCHDSQDVSGPQTFIYKACTHRLNAMELRNTLTSGYAPAQNMYHVLNLGDDNNSAANITVATQVAAATTGTGTLAASLLGQGTTAKSGIHPGLLVAVNQSIAPAFNQVVQNQSVLQSQSRLCLWPTPLQRSLPTWLRPSNRWHFQCNSLSSPPCSSSSISKKQDTGAGWTWSWLRR
jgi:hypothetical protein